jgi:hypothetical protein
MEQAKVLEPFHRALISPGAVLQAASLRINTLQGQPRQHQGNQLTPRLTLLVLDGLVTALAQIVGQLQHAIAQCRRWGLERVGHARLPAERSELTAAL